MDAPDSYLAMSSEAAGIVPVAACLRLTLINSLCGLSGRERHIRKPLQRPAAGPCPHYREYFFYGVKNSHYTFEKSSR